MVKKIGIGLLCALIVLTSFLTSIPKTYALSDETEYYGREQLERIMSGEKFLMEYTQETYYLNPIDQENDYYISITIDKVDVLMTCNYTYDNGELIMNIYILDISVDYIIDYNWGLNGQYNEQHEGSSNLRIANYDENGNPLIIDSLLINDDYNINDPWITFERQNRLNDYIGFSYYTNYSEANEETVYYITFEYSLITLYDDFYYEFDVAEEEVITTPIKSLQAISNGTFSNDISNLTPLYQYKYQLMHDSTFITDEMAYSNVMNTVFDSFGNILGTQIFPGISIGLVIGIPILLGLFLIILKLIRG